MRSKKNRDNHCLMQARFPCRSKHVEKHIANNSGMPVTPGINHFYFITFDIFMRYILNF